ncbi:MAG TPA: hypothetical protein VGF07_07670 [Stellaceae bacterium]
MRISLWLALAALLALAGCAAGAAGSDKDKESGFYGGVTGGWTQP